MSTAIIPDPGKQLDDSFVRAKAHCDAISIELRKAARKARVIKPAVHGGSGFQPRRADRIFRAVVIYSSIVLFVIPTVLCGIYLSLFAADQYISEARFAVTSGSSNALDSLASLSSIIDTGAARDGQIIAEYIESRAMVDALNQKYDVVSMFSPGYNDFVGEFKPGNSIEDFVNYWKSQVHVSVDRMSGLVTLRVRTFAPKDSQKLLTDIIDISELMVNKLARRNDYDRVTQSSDELRRAREKLERAVNELQEARSKVGILNVTVSAKAYGDVIASLMTQKSKVDSQISTLEDTHSVNSPQLVELKARSNSLGEQLQYYQGLIAGGTGNRTGVSTLAERDQILSQKELDQKIAESEYTFAKAAYEKARLTSERQRSYIQTYINPTLPEDSLYPKRILAWVTLTAVALMLWASFVGVSVLVRDNSAA